MTTMTDTDIVEALAKREGWLDVKEYTYQYSYAGESGELKQIQGRHPNDLATLKTPPSYLSSKDAIQPILDGLTEEEWSSLLDTMLEEAKTRNRVIHSYCKFYLTMKPRDLAICLVKALKLGKEGKG